MQENYIQSIRKQFLYYKLLGEQTFSQLNEVDLFKKIDEDQNSIAIIVNHLWGNMKSRWTNFLQSDGEKAWRNRDAEFEEIIQNKTDLLNKWNEAWTCLFTALDTINAKNFEQTIFIRNQGHTIVEALNRQLAHYAYRVGQIVFIGKMQKGKDWKSLSIPKGQSTQYNEKKFSKEKHQAHFTDEFLKDGST